MKIFMSALTVILLIISAGGCGDDASREGDAAYSEEKDKSVQEYNLSVEKEGSQKRSPYDTLALKEYVLNNYPPGSYIVEFDRTLTFNVPKPALLYYKSDAQYIFALIAKSRQGERSIEPKNVTGYESSFVNLDSTKLGTALFYLTLFLCENDGFNLVWERLVPLHGGFNKFTYKIWKDKTIPYIEVNFEDGILVGHRNMNFFMLRGIRSYPHLLETYEGISRRRTMANINNDIYPDYYEHTFYNTADRIYSADSTGFIWKIKDSLYVNPRNQRQTRPY